DRRSGDSSQFVFLKARALCLNWKRHGWRIDGTSRDHATRGGAPASGAGSMQNWVGETRQVRVNASEVAHRAQEEAALLDDRFDRVGVGEAVGGGGTAQQAHAECRGGRFKLTKLPLTCGQSLRVPGLRMQEDGQCEPQALEELAVHGGNCVELLNRERSAALDTPHGKLDQTVGDDVSDMLEVDHGRQNILSPRALPLVVEGLLVADVGEIAANRAAQLVDATILSGDRAGACLITVPKHLERIAEHRLDHV